MIRVLHYIPGFRYGGIESMYLSWYKNIEPNEVQFELLLRTQDDNASALVEYRKLGGVYYRLPPFTPRYLFAFKKAVDCFFREHHDYDILHVHSETPFVISTAKKYGIPKVIIHAHTASSDTGFKKNLKRLLYSMETISTRERYVDRAFACSDLAAKYKFGGMSFKGKPVEIIHNAIDTERFDFNTETRKKVRKDLAARDSFVIGHIGRMTYPKNQFFLLDIVKAYTEINPNSALWMIGGGPNEGKLKAYAVEIGISEKVRFLGVRNDVAELLQGMDCFLLPSRYEGLPVTLIEAQTAGLPCLISDVITRQVNLTDTIDRLPITVQACEWAEKLEDIRKKSVRRSYRDEMIEKGYDVALETDRLIMKYQSMIQSSLGVK